MYEFSDDLWRHYCWEQEALRVTGRDSVTWKLLLRVWSVGHDSRYEDSRCCPCPIAHPLGPPLVSARSPLPIVTLRYVPFKYFSYFLALFSLFFLFVVNFVIHWNETAMGLHVFPIPIPPSHLPLHPTPLDLPSAPGPRACLMHPTWAGDLLHPR